MAFALQIERLVHAVINNMFSYALEDEKRNRLGEGRL
jgi:hypothetical protein